jgi:hypothetical protein
LDQDQHLEIGDVGQDIRGVQIGILFEVFLDEGKAVGAGKDEYVRLAAAGTALLVNGGAEIIDEK